MNGYFGAPHLWWIYGEILILQIFHGAAASNAGFENFGT